MLSGLIALIVLQAAQADSSPFTTERVVGTLVTMALAILNLVQFRARQKVDQSGFIHETDTATINSLKAQNAQLKEEVALYKPDAEELPKVKRELVAHMSINAQEVLNVAGLKRETESYRRECEELRAELRKKRREEQE